MKNKIVSLIIVLALIAGVVLVFVNPFNRGQLSERVKSPSSSEVGQEVADFELESFDGKRVKFSEFLGKPVLIDFWAGWCPFCVEEMPEIEKVHKELGDNLVVLGIHRSETESIDVGTKFAKERGVTYTLLKDSKGQVYKSLTGGRNFMPYALYIDKEGKIVKVKAGPKTAEEIRATVKELVK